MLEMKIEDRAVTIYDNEDHAYLYTHPYNPVKTTTGKTTVTEIIVVASVIVILITWAVLYICSQW